MNPDVLACLPAEHTAEQAFAVVNLIQDMPRPETRVAAVLLTAMVCAECMGHRLPDVLTTLDNLSRDSTRKRVPNMEAMRAYFMNEVFNK